MSRILRRIAEEVLGAEKARRIWSRIDLVGDIAIVKSPMMLGDSESLTLDDLRRLAEELIARIPYIKSVWLAASPTLGEERVRDFIHLAGERRSETVYVEHGCKFKVDIAKVFITPRLSFEHIRVARQVKEGERVVNMFAGAGLFSIIIACKAKPRVVHSIDINPHAYKAMVENIKLNKVEGIVKPYLGDAKDVIERELRGSADRVLMPLPALALEYLPYALEALESNGIIHVYLHVHAERGEDPRAKAVDQVVKAAGKLGARVKPMHARVVRKVGPRWFQVVVDVYAEKPR